MPTPRPITRILLILGIAWWAFHDPSLAVAEEAGKLEQLKKFLEQWAGVEESAVQALLAEFKDQQLTDEGIQQMDAWLEQRKLSDEDATNLLLLMQAAVQREPDHPLLQYGLARALRFLNQYEDSQERLLKLVAQAPSPPSVYLMLTIGRNYCSLNHDVETVAWYTKILPEIHRLQSSTQFEIYNDLGNAFTGIDEPNRAIEVFEKAIAVDPSHPYPYQNMGLAYQDLKEWDKAVEYGEKALALERYPAAHFSVAKAYAGKGMHQEAIAQDQQAVELLPEYVDAWVHMGNQWMSLGNFGRAEEAYQRALAVQPDRLRAIAGLAWVANKRGRHAQALEHVDRALQLKAEDSFVLKQMEIARFGQEHPGASTDEFQAFDNRRKEAVGILQIVHPMLAGGRFQEAIPETRRAIEMNPYNTLAYEYLGYAYYQLKEFEPATASLRQGINLNPYCNAPHFSSRH